MIDLNLFRSRLQTYGCLDYAGDFDGFWNWKIGVETRCGHILDDGHREETFRRLCFILPKWQTYRGVPGINWRQALNDSLARISEAYNQIRNCSLLQFNNVSTEPLKLIWHELGRVKEEDGLTNQGGWYSIVAITKPLMFLWGQTLAFDSIVRACAPRTFNISQYNRWSFEVWRNAMENFQKGLERQREDINLFIEVSREKYQIDSFIPYGHFLDLYYWVEGRKN